jgi:hypothetical protein
MWPCGHPGSHKPPVTCGGMADAAELVNVRFSLDEPPVVAQQSPALDEGKEAVPSPNNRPQSRLPRRRLKRVTSAQFCPDFLPQSSLISSSHSVTMSLDTHIETMLQEIFVYAASGGAGAVLDKRITKARCKMRIGIFQSTRPIATLLSRRLFQMFLFVIGVAMMSRSTWVIVNHIHSAGSFEGQVFRFAVKELRQSSEVELNVPNAHDLSLLHNGCRIEQPANWTMKGSSLLVDFGKNVRANGWMFTTSRRDAAFDPAVFSLEACQAGSDSCTLVGGTDWQYLSNGQVQVSTYRRFNMPTERHRDVAFDYNPRYTVYLFLAAAVLLGLASLTSAALAALKVSACIYDGSCVHACIARKRYIN